MPRHRTHLLHAGNKLEVIGQDSGNLGLLFRLQRLCKVPYVNLIDIHVLYIHAYPELLDPIGGFKNGPLVNSTKIRTDKLTKPETIIVLFFQQNLIF